MEDRIKPGSEGVHSMRCQKRLVVFFFSSSLVLKVSPGASLQIFTCQRLVKSVGGNFWLINTAGDVDKCSREENI